MVVPSSLKIPDPASARVVLRQLDGHPVAGAKPGETGAQTIGDVSEDLGPVLQHDPKYAVREGLQHHATNRFGRAGHER